MKYDNRAAIIDRMIADFVRLGIKESDARALVLESMQADEMETKLCSAIAAMREVGGWAILPGIRSAKVDGRDIVIVYDRCEIRYYGAARYLPQ